MIAAKATPGRWVDSSTPLTPAVCAELVREGIVGVVRYVPLPNNPAHADISAAEAALILDAGLQLLLVQHVRMPPWSPSQHDGYTDGAIAAGSARAAGYAPGCHVFLDIEGVQGDAASTSLFCDNWARAVKSAGYRAGLYCGYSDPLSADQLYERPGFTTYWSDAGHRRVSTRGVAMTQGNEITIAGTKFDTDVIAPDLLGEVPWALTEENVPSAA
ncbi:MAG TPA: glycoside hydrolase domain-containing protein [Polyangiaceae bacterium]